MFVETARNSDSYKVTTPSDQEIRLTRLFDAPRQLVFEAMTKPEIASFGSTQGRLPIKHRCAVPRRPAFWSGTSGIDSVGISTAGTIPNTGPTLGGVRTLGVSVSLSSTKESRVRNRLSPSVARSVCP